MFELYNWFIPSKADWITSHQENETLKKLAEDFYNKLDSSSLLLLILALVIGVLGAIFYYYVLNNYSGRMYKISKWFIVWLLTVLVSWLISLGSVYFIASSELDGTNSIIFLFSMPQIFWTLLVYFITSFMCCNVGKTNAYRFLAIRNR